MRTEKRQREVETMHGQNARLRNALAESIRAMSVARIEKTEIYGPSLGTGKILEAAIQLASDALLNTPSEGPSKSNVLVSPDTSGGPILLSNPPEMTK